MTLTNRPWRIYFTDTDDVWYAERLIKFNCGFILVNPRELGYAVPERAANFFVPSTRIHSISSDEDALFEAI